MAASAAWPRRSGISGLGCSRIVPTRRSSRSLAAGLLPQRSVRLVDPVSRSLEPLLGERSRRPQEIRQRLMEQEERTRLKRPIC